MDAAIMERDVAILSRAQTQAPYVALAQQQSNRQAVDARREAAYKAMLNHRSSKLAYHNANLSDYND